MMFEIRWEGMGRGGQITIFAQTDADALDGFRTWWGSTAQTAEDTLPSFWIVGRWTFDHAGKSGPTTADAEGPGPGPVTAEGK